MTKSIAFLCELLFELLADGACFDLHCHVVVVDPEHAIHRLHVERDDHALLVLGTQQRLRDRRAAAVRNQTDVVLLRQRHDALDVLVTLGPRDGVRHATKHALTQRKDFLQRVTVRAMQSLLRIERQLALTLHCTHKRLIHNRFRNTNLILHYIVILLF